MFVAPSPTIPAFRQDRVWATLCEPTDGVGSGAGTDAGGIRQKGGRGAGDTLAVFDDHGMANMQFPCNLAHAETMHQKKQNLLLHVC